MKKRHSVKVSAETYKLLRQLEARKRWTQITVLDVAVDALWAEETKGRGYNG